MSGFMRSWRQDQYLGRILRNSGYLFSSNSISTVLSAIQGIIAARLLGVEAYGLVAGTVIVFVSNINRLLSFRMSEVVVKYLGQAITEGKQERAAAIVKRAGLTEAITSLVAYLVLLLLAPLAAQYLAKDPAAAPLFAFYGLVILANAVYETSTGALQVTGRFDRLALVNLIQSVVTVSLIGLAFLVQGSVVEVLGAYLLGKSLAGVMIFVFAVRQLNRTLAAGWWRIPLRVFHDWKEAARFAVSTNLNGTVNLIVRDSETLIIAAFRPQAEVGYFRIALSLINLVMMPIEPFIGPTYAEIARVLSQCQWRLTRGLLKRVSTISGIWTVSIGLFLVIAGPWLIAWLYGADYSPAYPAVLILLVGYGWANT